MNGALRRRHRPAAAALAIAALALVLPACGGRDRDDLDEVRAAIGRTSRVTRRFVYKETASTGTLVVQGLVQDDFRYKARLALGGRAAYDEVVSDDAIAARTLDRRALDLYARPPAAKDRTAAQREAEEQTLKALAARRWVLDRAGAPNLLAVANVDRTLGEDPVYDALTTLRYIDQVVLRNNTVVEFKETDLDYRPQEDPFPKPEDGSGIIRYDVRPERLPRAADSIAGGNQVVPGVEHFRKMAIYVKDGLIIRVLEDIDIASRLEGIERNYDIDLPKNLSVDEKVRISLDAINAVRRGQGEFVIRMRTMTLDLIDLGDDITVDLPADGVVEGDLSPLLYRGADDLRPTRGVT